MKQKGARVKGRALDSSSVRLQLPRESSSTWADFSRSSRGEDTAFESFPSQLLLVLYSIRMHTHLAMQSFKSILQLVLIKRGLHMPAWVKAPIKKNLFFLSRLVLD